MILEALAHQYQRLIERDEPGLSPYGYSPEKISYAIVLSAEGDPVDVQSLLDTSGKKPRPRLMNVPKFVWHADHNIGSEECIVVNYPTIQYNHASPDKYRLPIDTDLIPFKFDGARGW